VSSSRTEFLKEIRLPQNPAHDNFFEGEPGFFREWSCFTVFFIDVTQGSDIGSSQNAVMKSAPLFLFFCILKKYT